MTNKIDLSTLFKSVSQQLTAEKDTLNNADTYNHDHGDHMVEIFNLVQSAVSKKSNKPVADQLAYASKVVSKKASSGSAKLYADGLSKAAEQFSGMDLNDKNVGILLQSLLGAEKPQPKPEPQSNNLIGSLLSSLTGQSGSSDSDQSLGLDDILQAGMAFFQSKQEGESSMSAAMDALMAVSPMGQSDYRKQSASIVASTLMNFISGSKK